MLPTPRQLAAGATAGLLIAALATPAAATPRTALPHAASSSDYSGFSNGTLEYVNAANLPPADVAKAGLGQSASGVQLPGLSAGVHTDQLKQPLLIASPAGKTAYGHASGANAGLLGDVTAEPNVLENTLEEATSPAPSAAAGDLLAVPLDPVADADVLPSSALANTPADGGCVTGKDISRGFSSIANANVLVPSATTPVVNVADTSTTTSHEALFKQTTGANYGLLSQSTQNLAPVKLLAGTPAELTIKVLAPIQLSASAAGLAGTAHVSYGTTETDPTKPILEISGGGQTQTLTSQQVFGNGGFVIPLGVADVTIGAPAHSLTGLEGTPVNQSATGLTASATADFIRVTVPGLLPVPGSDPLDGPLAPLNAVLNPVLSGLAPITSAIQSGLAGAGLDLADVRVGHMESSVSVPSGGITCGSTENPLDESRKDVSATSVTAGQTFTYDIRVPNRGTSPITNVTVDDTYSAALEFVSSVPAPTSHSGNQLHYALGTIDPNEFDTIVMTFRVPANAAPGTRYHNEAIIRGTYQGNPISFPVSVDGPTVVGPLTGGCTLAGSSKYASNTHVKTGEVFGYFVNVFNSGGVACKNVVVHDTLISGVSFVSCTLSCTHSGQAVTWNLGTIAPGQSLVVSVLVKVTATSGRLPNAAIITTTNGTGGNPKTPGPVVDNTTVPAPGVPARLVASADNNLPRTGLSTGIAAGGLLLLLGGAVALRRRRLTAS